MGDNAPVSAASQIQLGQPTGTLLQVPERPATAANVQLVGAMQGSGFKDQQWLILRGDQFIQVTELLYRVAQLANGERTLEEIATGVTESTDWLVTADNVRQLIQSKLIPLGLVATVEGSVAPYHEDRASSPLQVQMRRRLLGPRILDPITNVLQLLYAPIILIPVLLAIAIAHGWLYLVHGVERVVYDVLYTPGLLLVVIAVVIVSSIFHEIGHAAGIRYGGGRARGIGMGFYIVYPTFYTDVTDAYRLGRWARLRTDLGGFYFHLIFMLGILGVYWFTGQTWLLLVAILINVDVVYQLLPVVRLDGYWAIADLTGIPDFFSQMKAYLTRMLPVSGLKADKLPPLKPWVNIVFATYIVLVIPALALFFFQIVRLAPSIVAIAWDAFLYLGQGVVEAQRNTDYLSMAASAAQMLILLLPVLGLAYFVYAVSSKPVRALWRWSQVTPARRLIGTLGTTAIIGVLAFLWAPQLQAPPAPAAEPDGVERFEVMERSHVQLQVAYPQTPPVGGMHAPTWQNCGFYDTPVANENAVHSMEHGAVWITYRPDLPNDQVDSLRQMAYGQSHVLVSPFPELSSPVVASAWGRQLRLDSADDPRLDPFVRVFQRGPQTPERGALCSGGVGDPTP
jgi:putative peptide zinc metalloprotease protein